eukprot:gene4276-6410_t
MPPIRLDASFTVGLAVGAAAAGVVAAVLLSKPVNDDEEHQDTSGNNSTTTTTTSTSAAGSKSGPGSILAALADHKTVYLDWNATTPIFPEVTETMLPFTAAHFGNPSSDSAFSAPCRAAVSKARAQAAALLDAAPEEIIFTGSGSESDNTAIMLAIASCTKPRRRFGQAPAVPHVVTTNIEHPAVEQYLAAAEAAESITVTRVKVNSEGLVSADEVLAAIKENTALVTVMHSNNEVSIAEGCRARGVLCHTDAAQSCGKVDVSLSVCPVDMMTVVGHKFGCPKGVSFLFVRDGCLTEKGRKPPASFGSAGAFLLGGGQEAGRRAGTENVLLISALGRACELAKEELPAMREHMLALRSRLLQKFENAAERGLISVRVNGPSDPNCRLPNTLSIGIKGVQSGALLASIKHQVAASAGSACHTGGGVSAILKAMSVPMDYAVGTLRLSVGRHTTLQDVDAAADAIIAAASVAVST